MDQTSPDHYTNGLDLHFDYSGESHQATSAKKKKKKKRKRTKLPDQAKELLTDAGKKAASIPLSAVDLNDPDADYPDNRVIKVGRNGDLIVESLDDDYEGHWDSKISNESNHCDPIRRPQPSVPSKDNAQTFLKLPGNLERSMFHFKNDDERRFWNELGDEERQAILDINIDMIMARFRQQRRHHPNTKPNDPGHKNSWGCNCANCGQNISYIQEELETAYLPHLDQFIESTWQISPSKHTHDCKKRTAPNVAGSIENVPSSNKTGAPSTVLILNPTTHSPVEIPECYKPNENQDVTNRPHPLEKIAHLLKQFPPEMLNGSVPISGISSPTQILGDPLAPLIKKRFVEDLCSLSKEGDKGIPGAIEYLKSVYSGKDLPSGVNDIADNMSFFADMLLNDNGQKFINMVEYIKKGENELSPHLLSEESPSATQRDGQNTGTTDITSDANLDTKQELHKAGADHESQSVDPDDVSATVVKDMHNDESEESDDDVGNDEDDHEDDDDEDEEDDDDDDYDSTHNEHERTEELRGLFMIQAIHLIREKFRALYEKKISEDKTRLFIEELEAEEKAKKDRELKKLKQKEEQKEKKRLQQLAKEDAKNKKLEAERKKAEALKQQQEAVRAEQIRRKEELRLKKLQEKEKKIEILRKKEQDKKEKERLNLERLEKERKEAEIIAKKKSEQQKEAASVESQNNIGYNNGAVAHTVNLIGSSLSPSVSLSTNILQGLNSGIPDLGSAYSPISAPSVKGHNNSNTELSPFGMASAITPATNHLLEQLYQAQPRLSIPTTPLPDGLDNLLRQDLEGQTRGLDQASLGSSSVPDLWAPNFSQLGPSSFLDTQPNTLWNSGYSRNSSIWGNSSNTQSWSASPNLASNIAPHGASTGGLAPQSASIPHPQTSAPISMQSMQPMQQTLDSTLQSLQANNPTQHLNYGISEQLPSRESIQGAAVEAFQILQQQNQLQFGSVGAHLLFLVSKSILQSPTLLFSEFLSLLHSATRAIFDLIYDDFGSVTHIKVTPLNKAPDIADHSLEQYSNGGNFNQANSQFPIQNFQIPNYGYDLKDDEFAKHKIW